MTYQQIRNGSGACMVAMAFSLICYAFTLYYAYDFTEVDIRILNFICIGFAILFVMALVADIVLFFFKMKMNRDAKRVVQMHS